MIFTVAAKLNALSHTLSEVDFTLKMGVNNVL